jgi:hypothetical protein
MYFSKIVWAALAGTATASSFLPDLNSTELVAVLAGAGPVIIETITVTEHLAVIPMRTPRYQWLNLPIRLTRIPTSSTIPDRQIVPRQYLHHGPEFDLSPEMTSSVPHSISARRIRLHRSRKSTTLAPRTSVSQPTTTSELPKTTDGLKRKALQNMVIEWMPDLKIVVGVETINPTWSMATKKWHGPHSHPNATTAASAPVEKETVEAVDVSAEDVPVITASAFKA